MDDSKGASALVWHTLRDKQSRLVVGLVAGTSADGIDAALVRISGQPLAWDVELIGWQEFPFTPEVKQAVFAAFRPETSRVDDICRLNYALGRLFAEAALGVIAKCGLRPADVDAIGFAGQTVYHIPEPEEIAGIVSGSTMQLGEPAVVAELTGILTVADLYTRDVAAGGKGAPLTPFADYVLFHRLGRSIAVQNIGGIGNIACIPAGAGPEQVIGFDTGPGNMVIDALVRHISEGKAEYDDGGRIAASGRVNEPFLERLLGDDFLAQPPPKATGRERYGDQYARSVIDQASALGVAGADLIATVTALTAASIATNFEQFVLPRWPVSEIVVAGGGAFNPTLLRFLQERLPEVQIRTFEDYGFSSKAREAIGFAIIANATLSGVPNNLPSVTGARRPVVLGKLVPP